MSLAALTAEQIAQLNRKDLIPEFGTRLAILDRAGYLTRDKWANPAAASQTAVLAATAQPAAGTTEVTTGITNPDFCRVLLVKGNQASCTGNVVIDGTDYYGNVIQDTIALSGTDAVAGTKAFRSVTKITLPTRGAGGDTVSVGYTDALGLSKRLFRNSVLWATHNGAYETTRPTVTFDSDELCKNTVDLNTALNGSEVCVYYLEERD